MRYEYNGESETENAITAIRVMDAHNMKCNQGEVGRSLVFNENATQFYTVTRTGGMAFSPSDIVVKVLSHVMNASEALLIVRASRVGAS